MDARDLARSLHAGVRALTRLPPSGRQQGAAFFAALALWVLPATQGVAQEAYLLGPNDVVNLRVAEWRTADATFRDWSAISGEYSVGAGGTISVPFVGEIASAGLTTLEVAKLVGDGLQQRFGLADRPDAAVEVATYRAIYVAGDVQSPGEHPFAPDLSVVKAVSLAGGQRRGPDAGLRVERDVIRAQSEFDVLTLETYRLLVRRARLQAELDEAETIELPDELEGLAEAQRLLTDERAIMEADRERLDLQVRSLNDLRELLANEVEALATKRVTAERQVQLSQQELADVGSLANRGLVVNTRVSELERRVADYETRLLDIDTSVLRARQDISRADQDLIRLRNDRLSDLATERQSVDAELESVERQRASQRALIEEAVLFAPTAATLGAPQRFSYAIVRTVNGEASEFAATENTPLQPGDVVKVTYDLPATLY